MKIFQTASLAKTFIDFRVHEAVKRHKLTSDRDRRDKTEPSKTLIRKTLLLQASQRPASADGRFLPDGHLDGRPTG